MLLWFATHTNEQEKPGVENQCLMDLLSTIGMVVKLYRYQVLKLRTNATTAGGICSALTLGGKDSHLICFIICLCIRKYYMVTWQRDDMNWMFVDTEEWRMMKH